MDQQGPEWEPGSCLVYPRLHVAYLPHSRGRLSTDTATATAGTYALPFDYYLELTGLLFSVDSLLPFPC